MHVGAASILLPMLEIVPFDASMLTEAGALLAASHARARLAEPLLPAAYEDVERAQGGLAELLGRDGAGGVAAVRDGHLAGFLIGVRRPPPNRVLSLLYHGQALAADESAVLYQDLYAVMAADWLRRGFFVHLVDVPHADSARQTAWDALGFGRGSDLAVRDLSWPMRDVSGPMGEPDSVEVRRGDAGDVEALVELSDQLLRHESTPPLLLPYLDDQRKRLRAEVEEHLAEPASTYFVARVAGKPVGMHLLLPRPGSSKLLTPDGSVYLSQAVVDPAHRRRGVGRALLRQSLAWAKEQGYEMCILHYMTANLSGSRFWAANGFRPLAQTRARLFEERITWAHA